MEYIKIENGKVIGHFCSNKTPIGKEFKEVKNFNSYVGIDEKALDFKKGGCLKPVEELISLGIVKDTRGKYYHMGTKREIEIKELDFKIPEKFTKLKPGQFDEWDGLKWVEDSIIKREYENSVKVNDAKNYLFSTDYMVIKCMEAGKGLNDLYPGETAKREDARIIIRRLSV